MTKRGSDLRWVLFEEVTEKFKKSGPNLSDTILSYLKRRTRIFKNPLIKFVLKCFRINYSIFSPIAIKKGEKRILFQYGLIRYDSIIEKASKKNAIILGLKKSVLWDFLSRRTMYFPIFDNVYLNLYLGLIKNNEDYLNKSLDELKNILKYLNPDVVVLNDDHLPASRALVLVSKELGIPTIAIQDGIYQSNSIIPSGKYVDYVFVWGEYFKELYVNRGIKEKDKIKVLGYPYELKIDYNLKENEKKIVYYLGQNFEDYDGGILDIKIETIKDLNRLCNNLGFDFRYRAHPQENLGFLKAKLPNIKFTPKRETLLRSLKYGNVFISFNSTSLVEAALLSKICIQLKNYSVLSDDFEELGICPTFYNLKEVADFLKNLSQKKKESQFYTWKVNEKYVEIPNPDIGTKFLELVTDII